MKKLFTLALVLLVATAGYSQVRKMSSNDTKRKAATMQVTKGMEVFENVQNEPNMVRSDGELDYSTYDWQSNCGPRTWTITWPDGKVNFAYTIASDNSFSDRGTGIGTYDAVNDVWTPLDGRIEDERTGFGSIARFKDNGIVVAAHTANDLRIYIVEDKDNMTANSVTYSLAVGSDAYTHPAVMTSGENRDIIHMAAAKFGAYEGDVYEPIRYWRSSDGGQTWDKEYVELPFLTQEYGINWGTNSYYWMETTEDNRLALVINNSWSDGMVIYSDDNGETWDRTVFYHHPGPFEQYPDDHVAFLYPRWTSAQWGLNNELCLAYEFNGTNDIATSTSGGYYPGIGGVAFWSENLPYHGESLPQYGVDPTNPMPTTPGQPFIMDSAYIMQDIYMSWMLWSDQTHDMFPEYMGYLAPLDENGQPEGPTIDDVTHAIGIEDFANCHGKYNCGPTAMPAMAKVGDNAFVAVWSSVDELNIDGSSNLNYFKLFASASDDGGRTWDHQVQLTTDFMFEMSECVYPQAAVVGNTLVVAAQFDGGTGSFVQNDDTESGDNYYQGLTFELTDLFPGFDAVDEVISHNTHMSVYPNPATDQIGITLSQNADIVIYNIMGQNVMTVEGHAGANTINISNLTSGIYFVNAGAETQKFIVK